MRLKILLELFKEEFACILSFTIVTKEDLRMAIDVLNKC